MVSMRYPLALLTVIQAGMMFLVLKRGGAGTALIGGLVLTSLSFVQFLNPTPNWYTLFLAVATITWLSWNPVGLRWRHIVTGFLVGTTFLFRQLSGVFLASGVLVFLLLEKPRTGASGGQRLARGMLALIAMGSAWYILRVTDPVGWVLFGVWPLAVVLWAWLRTRRSDREVLALLRQHVLLHQCVCGRELEVVEKHRQRMKQQRARTVRRPHDSNDSDITRSLYGGRGKGNGGRAVFSHKRLAD